MPSSPPISKLWDSASRGDAGSGASACLGYMQKPIDRVCSMTSNPDELQRRLGDQLCTAVRVEWRPDGRLMLATAFEFPDGDRFPIHLSGTPAGLRLSDKGDAHADQLRPRS